MSESLFVDGRTASATRFAPVVPDDDADLPVPARALLLASAGDLKVTSTGGDVGVLPLQAGYNPIQVRRVWAEGKTAGDVIALWG